MEALDAFSRIDIVLIAQTAAPPWWLALVAALIVVALAWYGYRMGNNKALAMFNAGQEPHSTPDYYGWYMVALMYLPPALFTAAIGLFTYGGLLFARTLGMFTGGGHGGSSQGVAHAIEGFTSFNFLGDAPILPWAFAVAWIVVPALILFPAYGSIKAETKARFLVERTIYGILLTAASISVVTTAAIAISVIFESLAFFAKVSWFEFLFGTTWNPGASFLESAGRADDSGEQGARFGAVPLFYGTLMITFIAMLVAVPVGVMAAVFLSEYATLPMRRFFKPMLEILAGIPTVVYGFFAAITVAPTVVWVVKMVVGGYLYITGQTVNADGTPMSSDEFWQAAAIFTSEIASFENALTAGAIMGVMIIPFMSSLCDDVISAVPQALRRGAYGMGATKAECIIQVVLPAALPGIISAFLLAVSRAIGETMIVVMAAGLNPSMTINPLEQVTTVTVHIVSNLTGDLAFDNPQTLSAFSLGLVLLVMTLGLNIVSAFIIRRFRAQYE
ncbi:MAG: phosphate ABC transporter permease subunit PstC [Planctomycetota bacterium]